MWDMVTPKILVAVEHVGSGAGLAYAARDAVRRGCGVHLVHVVGPAIRAACAYDDVVLVEDVLRSSGRMVLAEAASRTEWLLDQLAPDDLRLSVSTELAHGSVVATLGKLSPHACCAVLEHRGMGPVGETESPSLSVTAGVAARAACPVVAVPSGWDPERSTAGLVTVGVDLAQESQRLVAAALHEAGRRGGRLRLVHVEPRSSRGREVELREVRDTLEALIRDLGVAPRVSWEVVVERGPAHEVLRSHAGESDLLVLGRHHRRHLVGARLGATSRDLLRWSPAPVLLVDPVRGDQRPDATPTAASARPSLSG